MSREKVKLEWKIVYEERSISPEDGDEYKTVYKEVRPNEKTVNAYKRFDKEYNSWCKSLESVELRRATK